MINKFLFFFISWFNKKVDISDGQDEHCYYAASALVGMTMAVSLYAVVNVVSIAIINRDEVYRIISKVMNILCIIACCHSCISCTMEDGQIFMKRYIIHPTYKNTNMEFVAYCMFLLHMGFGSFQMI